MSRNHGLDTFGIGSGAPHVIRKIVVWSPTAPGKPAGFIGYDTERDVRVYTTRRSNWHYYYEGDGYAISDSIIQRCRNGDVARVLVHTKDDGDVYEFPLHAYEDGPAVLESDLDDPEDPQSYVPLDEAMNEWPGYARHLFRDEFSRAMDRITSKRGWDPRDS